MKILLIPSTMLPFPPVKGGAVQNIIKSYVDYNEQNRKHQLCVFSIYDKNAKKAAKLWEFCSVDFIKVPYLFFKLRDRNNSFLSRVGFKLIHIYYSHKITKKIKQTYSNYDLIVLDNTPQFAQTINKTTGKKVYIHIYNDYLNTETKDICGILSACLKVITVSDYITKRVLQTGFISKDRVITLYNGINLERFGTKQSTSRRVKLRKDMGIDENAFVYICVARLVPEKGIRELIMAFNSINNKHVHLIIIGNKLYSGKVTDSYLLHLKALAEQKKSQIHFIGYVDYNVLPDYYMMADVGVLPSLYEEPFALSALEYMASGLAVIVSDAGGFPEMAEGNAAIIVKRGECFVKDLAMSMKLLLDNPEIYQAYRERGMKKSVQFSAENYCRKFDEILDMKV